MLSASINPHVPSFHIQGGERGDGEEVWERLAASRRPQGANICQGEASRRQGQVKASRLPNFKKKVQVQQAEEEEEKATRDGDIDSLE